MKKPDNYVTEAFLAGRPLVYGHRGSRAYAPMNTLPAFELAIQQEAQGIELDVQLSSDRKLVIIHDFTVEGTTDGIGTVKDLLFVELRELNAAAKFTPMDNPLKGHIPHYPFTMIPTLEEAFTLVKEGAPPDFIVNVEIKAPYCNEDGTEELDADNGIETIVAECIERYEMDRNVIISSFNPSTLRRFKAVKPNIPVGFLVEELSPTYTTSLIAQWLPQANRALGHEAWHPRFSMVTPELVVKEQKQGRMTQVWTVNDVELARKLTDWGVTGLITDMPDRIIAAIN